MARDSSFRNLGQRPMATRRMPGTEWSFLSHHFIDGSTLNQLPYAAGYTILEGDLTIPTSLHIVKAKSLPPHTTFNRQN